MHDRSAVSPAGHPQLQQVMTLERFRRSVVGPIRDCFRAVPPKVVCLVGRMYFGIHSFQSIYDRSARVFDVTLSRYIGDVGNQTVDEVAG